MKPLIELFAVVVLFVSQAYSLNDSLEYDVGHSAFSLNLFNSSNSSPLYKMYNPEKPDAAIVGNYSWLTESRRAYYINQSADINYGDQHSFRQANFTWNQKNRSNLSTWSETTNIKISENQIYSPNKPRMDLADKYSGAAWALNTQIFQQINSSSYANNLTNLLSLNSTIWDLNKLEQSSQTNESNESKIVVHPGESIQAAIDAATSGDIIEINSGTYNESIRINKRLTIRGVDIGGGLPIIDANRKGNAIDISADQVILEKIISTNSSNANMKLGAGIRFSHSNNCSIKGINSNNNYYDIELVDSVNNAISESNISSSEYGVRIYYSNNNSLERCNVTKNVYPFKIVSPSEGNLIQGNIFRDNSNKVEISKENKFIDNDEILIGNHNESKQGVNKNTGPEASQPYDNGVSGPSQSSDSGGDEGAWVPQAAPIDEGKEYNNLAQKAAGTLVFNPPKVMTRNVGEWIDARIGLENTTRLVQGLLGKGEAKFRNISVETNMTYVVKLEGDSGFEISAKRPAAQILGADPAVWLWLVTPLDAGNHTLILSVDLQLEKPPYNCRCVNVTYWPVIVNVLEPSPQQKAMELMSSSYTLIVGIIAFLASLFSLILLFRELRKGKDEKNKKE